MILKIRYLLLIYKLKINISKESVGNGEVIKNGKQRFKKKKKNE